MPRKGEQGLQTVFKKANSLLDIIENTSDTVLYIKDESRIIIESNNYFS